MKIIFQGGFDRNSVALRTITQSGQTYPRRFLHAYRPVSHTNSRQFFRVHRPVISTEAAHSFIVGRAVEKSASLPYLPPSPNRVVTVARFRLYPPPRPPKNIL